jgi:hypothetical protein
MMTRVPGEVPADPFTGESPALVTPMDDVAQVLVITYGSSIGWTLGPGLPPTGDRPRLAHRLL